jgi:hypothetical protein
MTTKLFILLFATVLGAVITGCNRQPDENTSGSSLTNSPPPMVSTNLTDTNSLGTVNTPSITTSNNVPMTNQ